MLKVIFIFLLLIAGSSWAESGGNDQSVSENQDPMNLVDQLERLSELFSDGLLSEEEFQAAKQRILDE